MTGTLPTAWRTVVPGERVDALTAAATTSPEAF